MKIHAPAEERFEIEHIQIGHLKKRGSREKIRRLLRMNTERNKVFWILVLVLLGSVSVLAQRTGYSKGEFEQRRTALMTQIEEGMIVLFGECLPQPGAHFRQDNDFFYFSGREDKNAVILMAPRTKETFYFLPRQTPREEKIEGPNLLKDSEAKKRPDSQISIR